MQSMAASSYSLTIKEYFLEVLQSYGYSLDQAERIVSFAVPALYSRFNKMPIIDWLNLPLADLTHVEYNVALITLGMQICHWSSVHPQESSNTKT